MTGIRRHLAQGAFWTLASRAIVNVISLLSTFLLVRLLTPGDFGLVAIATTILEIISAATNLSLGSALIRHENPTDDDFRTSWTLSVLRSVAVGCLLAAASWPVATFYHDERLIPIMLAFAGSVVITGFANPKLIVFSRNLVFSQDFFLQVSQKVMSFAVSIVLALLFHSYWALVCGVIVSKITYVAVSYILLPYRPRASLARWKELFSFSFWMTLQDLLYALSWGLDHLLIGALAGRTSLGHFSVGSNLAALPMREAGLSITKLLFPGLARVMRDPARIKSAYVAAQALLSAVILPVGFGIALCARPAVMWLIGPNWLPVIPVIQGLSAIMALQTLGTLAKPLAMAQGVTRRLFHRNLLNFIVCIPLSVIGLLTAGLNGVVAARVVSGVVAIGFDIYLVRELISLPIARQITLNGRSLSSTAAMTAGGLAFQWFARDTSLPAQLAGTIGVGGLLYVGTSYALWLLAGKGAGPERELLDFVDKMVQAARSRPVAP